MFWTKTIKEIKQEIVTLRKSISTLEDRYTNLENVVNAQRKINIVLERRIKLIESPYKFQSLQDVNSQISVIKPFTNDMYVNDVIKFQKFSMNKLKNFLFSMKSLEHAIHCTPPNTNFYHIIDTQSYVEYYIEESVLERCTHLGVFDPVKDPICIVKQ